MITLKRPEGILPEDFQLSRRAVGAMIFAGYAAAGLSAEAEPITTDDTGLITDAITVRSGDFALPAYIARPQGAGRHPTVLVVSEIFGLHAYIKDLCRRLAKLGYVAIAPAFFVRVADPAPLSDIGAVIKIVRQASDQQVMGDIAATLAFLKAQPFVDAHRLGVTGFCWGGGVTWLACEQFADFRVGAAWYGRMQPPKGEPDDPARLWPIRDVAKLKAPVLGLYGGKDPLTNSVPAMRQALDAAGKSSSQIVVYADAGHGFHADYRAGYNPNDAADAWGRMLRFFRAHGV